MTTTTQHLYSGGLKV